MKSRSSFFSTLVLLGMTLAPPTASVGYAAEPPATTTNGLGMKLVLIPAGTFTMGSPEKEDGRQNDEEPRREVRITKPFYLGTTEVTREQWTALMQDTNWRSNFHKEGANFAATYVNWNDANEFCSKLSAREGKTYRLPTEAEWEYACRAGTTTAYHYGEDRKQLGAYAWFTDNSRDPSINGSYEGIYVHPVAQKRPNAWGLYDMHGNAHEWCNDWYADKYDAESPIADPLGAASGNRKIVRGGSYGLFDILCRSADRYMLPPDDRTTFSGLRVVCEL